MKKTLTILAIVVVALVAMMSSVNAASVNVQPTNVQIVKAGEEVTVTVGFAACKGITFDLTYDSDNFEYKSSNARVNAETAGKLTAGNIDAGGNLTSVTFKFKALKDITATPKAFSATNMKLSGGTDDSTAAGSLVITPATTEPTTEPTDKPTTGGETTKPGDTTGKPAASTESPATSEEETVVGTNGKAITKLPQTGAPVFIGVIALVAVVGAVFAIRKIRK